MEGVGFIDKTTPGEGQTPFWGKAPIYVNPRQLIKGVLPKTALNAARSIRKLSHLAWHDVRRGPVNRWFPMKPSAISFMANDICNSKCQMCLIWEQKKDHEVTVAEFEQLLSEPLFSQVSNIGVTGGEPTLRKDLPQLFEVIVRRPAVRAASMITNAIIEKHVKVNVRAAAEICARHNVDFSVMVSLDGLGDVHDTVRGRAGNFDTAIACIEDFRSAGITTTFGCTITKSNVYHVDELLDYAIANGITGRFRIAEFIERLYNTPQSEHIRNFDADERYHLGLFYTRLLMGYEQSPKIRKTYHSVRGMLVDGKPRATGCPYHADAVILTSRGELLYCSPKSPNLGSILEKGSASRTYFTNLRKRDEIRSTHCSDCIHDYHVDVTFRDQVRFFLKNRRIDRVYGLKKLVRQANALPAARPVDDVSALNSRNVLIVGWYGTETVGDKAILWTLIRRLHARSTAPRRIVVSSFYPFITRQTIREMDLGDVEVVETWTPEFEAACEQADEVTIGGGPLMELRSLDHMLYAFLSARRRGAVTRIDSCGIGPLETEFYSEVVVNLLRLASDVRLRDTDSAAWARAHAGIMHCHSDFDPAVEYIEHCATGGLPAETCLPQHTQTPPIACFLRDWPINYRGARSEDEFQRAHKLFDQGLIALIRYLNQELCAPAQLLPMHTFYEGGDDRIFGRRLAQQIQRDDSSCPVFVPECHVTPWQIVAAMQTAQLCVCMRFHSVVFASTLQRPFLAIDYTNNGKIAAFLRGRGQSDRLISIDEICDGRWRDRIVSLITTNRAA